MRFSQESIFTIGKQGDGCGSDCNDRDGDEEYGDDAAALNDDDVDEDTDIDDNYADGGDEDLLQSPPTKVGGLDRCRVTPVKMGAPPLRHISSSSW